MTKYTNNEQYENDKARLINILIGGGVEDFAVNLLKQSKWIGDNVKPIPVLKDGNGKLIKDYKHSDWIRKLLEEFGEVIEATLVEDDKQIAKELQDLKHVCHTAQLWLGYTDKEIDEICVDTNEKNRIRGYLGG